jgi:hypothetical protein
MRNFKLTRGDYDYEVRERVLTGHITHERWQRVLEYTQRYNQENAAPYGISERGSAYTCGCSHDCCGCLVRTHMIAQSEPHNNRIVVAIIDSFNY